MLIDFPTKVGKKQLKKTLKDREYSLMVKELIQLE